MKRWGRYKIRDGLKKRAISAYCIKQAMREIDESAYYNTLCRELERRSAGEKPGMHPYKKRRKLADYMFSRGYESGLVWAAIEDLGL
jgi:regulatory protein